MVAQPLPVASHHHSDASQRDHRYHARMAVYLDDQALSVQRSDLAAALEAARAVLGPNGRIVVRIELDGRTIEPRELSELLPTDVGGNVVRMTSAHPRELAGDALEAVRRQLDRAQQDLTAAGELLQQDRHSEAMARLSQGIEVWQHTQQAVTQSALLLGIKLENMSLEEQSVTDLINDTRNRIRGVRDLITAKDMVALADTLQYEWPTLTQRWQGLIDVMLKTIDEKQD